MTKTFILTFDGGGIRGYITVNALANLLSSSDGNFLPNVTLSAGTSTGSFIALGLAAGIPISTIQGVYQQNNAQLIFTPNPNSSGARTSAALTELRDRAGSLGLGGIWNDILKYFAELTKASYTNTGLASVASNFLGGDNGPLTLGSLKPVLLNTLQLDDSGAWTPQTITNWGSQTYNNMYAYEAGMCSGAAPIYFPPFSPSSQASLGYCADGGLFANNPSMSAITAAVQQQNALSDIYVLSFDTGTTSDGMSAEAITNWGGPLSMGPVEWLFPASLTAGDTTTPKFPLLSALMDSSSAAITAQAASLLGANYYRVTVPLPTPVALDDTTDAAYTTMNDALTAWQQSANFNNAVSWLKQNVGAQ